MQCELEIYKLARAIQKSKDRALPKEIIPNDSRMSPKTSQTRRIGGLMGMLEFDKLRRGGALHEVDND